MANPRHPVYILSKGRAEERKAVRWLDHIGVPFRVVVEPQDEASYKAVIPEDRVVVMDKNDQGIQYVRNYIWEHSISIGAEWHWQLDDDIEAMHRQTRNMRINVMSGTPFKLLEDYVDRFENVGQAGFNYSTFIPRKYAWMNAPVRINRRVYSCFMNRNDLPFRYRTPLNEDTDMSLQILKAGWCTIMFNGFLVEMPETMKQKGGQTDLYVEDKGDNPKRIAMARKLVELHPDVTSIVWKWNRWQHFVDYRPFQRTNKLRLKPGVEIPQTGMDSNGLVLERLVNGKWERGHSLPSCEGVEVE